MLFLHMEVVSDRLRTMLGLRRSAIIFCWASPPHTGSRTWEEAPKAFGQGLGSEIQTFRWATRQGEQYQPQSGPIFQSTCGLAGDMRWARTDEARCK